MGNWKWRRYERKCIVWVFITYKYYLFWESELPVGESLREKKKTGAGGGSIVKDNV